MKAMWLLGSIALPLCLIAMTGRAGETQTIVIDNFSFRPRVVTVTAGTHILFRNLDDLPHTVVVPDLGVKSSMLDTGSTYETSFDKPGDYAFFCGIHPKMTGEVIVKAE